MSKRSPHGHLPYYVLNYAKELVRSDRPLTATLARAYEIGPQVIAARPDLVDDPGPAQYPCPVPLPTSYLADRAPERDRTLWAGLMALKILDRRVAQGKADYGVVSEEWMPARPSKTYRSKGGRS